MSAAAPSEGESTQSRFFVRPGRIAIVAESTTVTHIPAGTVVELVDSEESGSCAQIRYADATGNQIVGFVNFEFLTIGDDGTATINRDTLCITEVESPEQVVRKISPDREVVVVEDDGGACVTVEAFDLEGNPVRGMMNRTHLEERRPDCPQKLLLGSADMDPSPFANIGKAVGEMLERLLRRR